MRQAVVSCTTRHAVPGGVEQHGSAGQKCVADAASCVRADHSPAGFVLDATR